MIDRSLVRLPESTKTIPKTFSYRTSLSILKVGLATSMKKIISTGRKGINHSNITTSQNWLNYFTRSKLLMKYFTNGQHPLLLKQLMSKRISLETVSILESILGFCRGFDKEIEETIVCFDRKKLIKNYSNLLTIDVNEYRIVTMNLTKEYFDV